ncbi:MAG: hypothetical protein WBP29_11740 [Candidatus Zixiibacteriota bacterium]
MNRAFNSVGLISPNCFRMLPVRILMIVLLAPILIPTNGAGAQSDSAYMIIYDFFDAAIAGQWRDYAKMTHPDELRRFRAEMLDNISEISPSLELEIEFAQQFFGTSSLESARKMEPVRFFEKMVEAIRSISPDWYARLRRTEIAVGDFVPEGDSLRHYVLWRIYPAVNSQLEELDVFTLRKRGDRWYCTLVGEFEPRNSKIAKSALNSPQVGARVD